MDGTAGGPFIPSIPHNIVLNLTTAQNSLHLLSLVNYPPRRPDDMDLLLYMSRFSNVETYMLCSVELLVVSLVFRNLSVIK